MAGDGNRSQISADLFASLFVDVLIVYVVPLQSFVDRLCKAAEPLNEAKW